MLDGAMEIPLPTIGGPAKRKTWSIREATVVRTVLPCDGLDAALPLLPGRTRGQVQSYGYRIGVHARRVDGLHHAPWATNEHIDNAIRRVYQENPNLGSVRNLAQTLGRPRQWVRKRAEQLGCVVPRFKEPPWSQAEDDIVRAHAPMHIDQIAKKLRAAGYRRTSCGVRQRMFKIDGIDRERPDVYTASEVARWLGVDRTTPTKWIGKGWLRAKKRQSERADKYEDGWLWEIKRKHLRSFIIANVSVVDMRRCDKYWLVELLANRE